MHRFTAFALLLGVLTVTACGDSPASPSSSSPTTYLSLESSPGDGIGNGFTQRVGLSEGIFSARVYPISSGRQSVAIDIKPSANQSAGWWWTLWFTMPPGEPLHTGTFVGVHRWPGADGQAGMDFSGSGRGCSFLTGSFTVKEVVVGQASGGFEGYNLDRLLVTFEQVCDGAKAPIRGEISIAANPWR